MRQSAFLSLTCALVGFLGPLSAADLISDGGFAGDGAAAAWKAGAGVEIATDPASRFMHLEADPAKMVMAYQLIPVNGIKALRLSYRARWKGVQRGSQMWFDARVILDFKDKDKQKVAGGPGHPSYTGSSDGWQPRTISMLVPDGAAYLEMMPCLFNAKAGTFDLDDISLVAIDPAEIPAKPAKDATAKKEAKVDAGGAPPTALKVDGNRIRRADGTEVWLQGASVDSLQWSNTGEDVVNSVIGAIDEWKANTVRLPMNEERWFGQAAGQTDNGAAYRGIIDQCVKAASSRGAYLILDLHRFRAPTEQHVAFWKDAANTYKDDPAVIFELFNEPHDIPWEVWRNGGDVTNKRKEGDTVAENAEKVVAFRTVGMQALLEAVRSTGAKNLVLAGGLDYAYDASGVLNGFALQDEAANLAYVAHVYPWKSDWQHKFLDVAKVHPIVMTEVGCDAVRYSFIPPERHENPYTWAPDMIACIQKYKLHWTAFSFHRSCGPPMLMKGDGFVPTPFWGSFVRAALSGAQFTSGTLR